MGRRRALLVATYEYEDAGLRQLNTPAQDAEALADVLEDPAIAGFEVQMLINEPTSRVGEAIDEFYATAERDDLTLLYFSGHGLKDDNGRLYLAMKNTRRERLRFSALPAHMIDEAVAESSARQKILILDCCYGGAYAVQQLAKADSAVHTKTELGGRGRIVLTATDSTQYAFEGSQIHGEAAQSVFTRHVVEGLRSGAADLDADGDITADELYRYVYDAVVAEQPSQRPKQFADVEGRTVIAANVGWTLPERITANLGSQLQPLREAGLQELGQLLQASNEHVRETAKAKLEELTNDDSRTISTTAQAYLDAPPPQTRPQPVASPQVRRRAAAGPTFGGAPRATVRRWRDRVRLPTVDWAVFLLTVAAAGLAVAAAVLDATWYSVAVASVLVVAVVAQLRLREAGAAFVAGLSVPGLVSALLLTSWLTHLIPVGLQRLPGYLDAAAHGTWLAAGVVSFIKWRPGRPRPELRLVLLGAAAAILILVMVVDAYRGGPHLFKPDLLDRLSPVVLGILGAELALACPLLNLGRPFLAGWVVGGFVVWIGLVHPAAGFSSLLLVLFAVWLLLGIVGVIRPAAANLPTGRWFMAATLLAPAVLGGVAVAVVPPAARAPIAIGLAVSPDSQFLYAADIGNERIIKLSTTTRKQIGDALRVGVQPSRLDLSPDGKTLYVANSGSGTISVIDVAAWKVVGQPIAVAPEPTELTLSVAAHRLYVLSKKSQTITEVNTETMQTVGGPLASGANPADIAVDDKGKRLYIAGGDSDTVAVIDTLTRQPARSPIPVESKLRDLTPGADGALYALGSSSYAVINTNVETTRPTPQPLPDGSRIAASDGKRLYILGTEGANDVVRIVDLSKHQVVESLTDDLGATVELAVSQDGQRMYVSNFFQDGILVLDTVGPKVIDKIELKS
ncbi:caspase family protein [Kribbella sp. NBC_00709]|uniref:caspase, EACC1-associated type n=1 Tax=Kribbella sp. NBC_00709 TaxID=2975972 RepID=UPI002E284CB5|nr:caspase family protein [Kribbella sp. NBC_00709]